MTKSAKSLDRQQFNVHLNSLLILSLLSSEVGGAYTKANAVD